MPSGYIELTGPNGPHLAATPLTLAEADLEQLRGINEQIDLEEVAAVYLPLSRLLNLYVSAVQDLHRVSATFSSVRTEVPTSLEWLDRLLLGRAHSVESCRHCSQLARPSAVDLVTTDGFLYPNAELQARGLMERKGFPESYDTRALIEFLRNVKSGATASARFTTTSLMTLFLTNGLLSSHPTLSLSKASMCCRLVATSQNLCPTTSISLFMSMRMNYIFKSGTSSDS